MTHMTAQAEALVSSGIANIAHQYASNTELFNRGTADIAPDHWFAQPCKDSNHLMWIAGHILNTRSGVVTRLLGGQPSSHWGDLFARGGKLVERSKYPSPQEIRDAWAQVAKELAAAFSNATDEVLSRPGLGAPVPEFDGKSSGSIAFFAMHETYHVGQLAYLRKFLGYSQLLG